jgi:hypothetical protein
MSNTARQCDDCTACCDGRVRIIVQGFEAQPGKPCPNSTGRGDDCTNRPVDPCVHFNCGCVLAQSPLPDWMKPNRAGVLVPFYRTSWQGVPVDLTLPVGRRIPGRCLDRLKAFAQQRRRLPLYAEQVEERARWTGQQRICAFGPPTIREAVAERERRGPPHW